MTSYSLKVLIKGMTYPYINFRKITLFQPGKQTGARKITGKATGEYCSDKTRGIVLFYNSYNAISKKWTELRGIQEAEWEVFIKSNTRLLNIHLSWEQSFIVTAWFSDIMNQKAKNKTLIILNMYEFCSATPIFSLLFHNSVESALPEL